VPVHPITLPELGFADRPMLVSLWFAKTGSRVKQGDQLLEILCGSLTFDLAAPTDGVLLERAAAEGEQVAVGQRLAMIESDS
jgi:2-oxoglutarate dehydrogenase E2 component (dihydrolipoamide succinyltransferase)